MRRNNTFDSRKAKAIARQKYAERQIDKFVKWSWDTRGKVLYTELVEYQNQYGIKCYG